MQAEAHVEVGGGVSASVGELGDEIALLAAQLDAALAAGRISYAKVRAITRVATPETEGRLVEMAAFSTGLSWNECR